MDEPELEPEQEQEPTPGGSKRARCENSSDSVSNPLVVNGTLEVAPSCRLGEHELRMIFSRYRISGNDLISCRLVNKFWCGLATAALLKWDACYVSLAMNPRADGPDPDATTKILNSHFYKHGDRDTTWNKLSSLTHLISTSPQFPTCSFHIQASKFAVTQYHEFPDLVQFFDLHGKEIKSLRLAGLSIVSELYLFDIFFTYATKLECLDLREARLGGYGKACAAEWNSRTIPIQSLIIGYGNTGSGSGQPFEILSRLLSSASRLSSIENVRTTALPVILEHGKGALIKSFEYTIPGSMDEFRPFFPLIQQFAALNPKLTQLTLAVHKISPAPAPASTFYADTLPFLNAIMESSKDTLQKLDLCVDPTELRTKLKIPPMANLAEISLRGILRFHDDTQEQEPGSALIENVDNCGVFAFDDEVLPETYFPKLVKILLKSEEWSISESILCLEKFLSNSDGSRRDKKYCGNVYTLEVRHSFWPGMSDANLIAELLPNIRFLKIRCQNLRNLNHSLWVMCPLVEFIEIKGLSTQGFFISTDRCLFFDTFFSGFCLDTCTKLQATELSESESVDRPGPEPETFDLLRIHPSVLDLQHLKEFKLKYSGKFQLVSRVAEKYVFEKMPNTKFNILYCPDTFETAIDHYEDQFEDEKFAYRQKQTARRGIEEMDDNTANIDEDDENQVD